MPQAVDEAVDGDTIEVCPDTHYVALVVEGKSLTLSGLGAAADVVLDARASGSVLALRDATVTLEHLTLTGGSAEEGGGIACEASTVLATDVLVTGNTAEYGGGIALSEGCTLTGDALFVESNKAERDGGGLYSEAIVAPNRVSGVVARDNDAGDGAGAYVAGQTPDGPCLEVEGSTFELNRALDDGGGLYLELEAGASVLVSDSAILSNSAPSEGGGVWVLGTLEMRGTEMSDNAGGQGGGLFALSGSDVQLWSPIFHRNQAREGGAIYLRSDLHLQVSHGDFGYSSSEWNVPGDVAVWGDLTYEYGADASFSCDGRHCQ